MVSNYPCTIANSMLPFKLNTLHFEEFYLARYNTMQPTESQPVFWRNMSPPSSWSNNMPSKTPAGSKQLAQVLKFL
jgi:hypothetical protein